MITFITLFILFFIYSVIGWIIEIISCSYGQKKLIKNRGFLIGPYCPIYGFGAIAMTLLLGKYLNDPLVLFVMAIIITSTLEYFTSYILEKIFSARWWDYSDRKFNINGRVVLTHSMAFGTLGLILMYYTNPFIINILNSINITMLSIIFVIFFVIFILDTIISVTTVFKIRFNAKLIIGDSTEYLSNQVKNILKQNKIFQIRLIKAFPNLSKIDIMKKIKEILEKERK